MPKPRPLCAAADREAQRLRIVAAIRNGVSYDTIARRETISRERVLEIVVETMRRNDDFGRPALSPGRSPRLLRRVEGTARKTKFPEIRATPGVNPRRPSRNPLKAKQTAQG